MLYRKKPVEIEAFRFSGINKKPDWFKTSSEPRGCSVDDYGDYALIYTLEGTMRVNIGDWVIKGVNGELYPCKDEIFRKTYERADGADYLEDTV